MLTSNIKDRCIKCKKHVLSRQNRTNCNLCKKVIHLKCTELTKSQFQSYQKGKLIFYRIYCTNYLCLKCENIFMIRLIVCVAISVINEFIKPVLK